MTGQGTTEIRLYYGSDIAPGFWAWLGDPRHAAKKIKIPDVCDAFDVAWTDPFSSFRRLGMRLAA